MALTRQRFLIILAAAAAAALALPAAAQDGTIRILVGYPPGATSDCSVAP